jgi:hypothetical protein
VVKQGAMGGDVGAEGEGLLPFAARLWPMWHDPISPNDVKGGGGSKVKSFLQATSPRLWSKWEERTARHDPPIVSTAEGKKL